MNAILSALLWLDVKVFALITFGRALPGETISAAAWNGEQTGKIVGKLARPVIDLLFKPWQADHCRQAWYWQQHIYIKE